MKRGTTYTQILTVAGVDLRNATEVIVTLKPMYRASIELGMDRIVLSSDGTDTTIAYKLTEEQSLALDAQSMQIDVNWMLDGTRGGTRIATRQISRTLLGRILGGGSDEPDPSAPDPDPINLTSEEVRVLNAISPKITDITHSGTNTVITIKDVAGEHEVEIPDGQRGPQGVPGPAGKDGKDGADGAPGRDGTDGKDGTDGQDGADGYSPTASVSKSGSTATITITDKNGTTTATVSDGQDGQDGQNGQDGAPGVGVPTGGTTGQVLKKKTDTDYDTEWAADSSGVSDVQVNGTSVVTSGVANVPLAGSETFGVVKCGTGLLMQSGGNAGKININPATISAIKGGSEYYKPITPNHQHEAAFYGIASAAGDSTQSSSSNAVGQYTDAAKVAIQKMLGIYESPWEIINEGSFDTQTETACIINVDSLGQSFELTDLKLLMWVPKHDAQTIISGYWNVYFYNSNTRLNGFALAGAATTTVDVQSTRYGYIELVRNNGLAEVRSVGSSAASGTGNLRLATYFDASGAYYPFTLSDVAVDEIRIYSVTGLLNYRLYGRRKWN